MKLRVMMNLPLGECPDGARTIPDLRTACGWMRAGPFVAAAGVLLHPGALRRNALLQCKNGMVGSEGSDQDHLISALTLL